MKSYDLASITKNLYNSSLVVFNLKTLKDILNIERESSLYDVIKRLIESRILQKIERNKYIIKDKSADSFLIANLLYSPSYVSFESALNLHGVLSQFPYTITSATTKNTKEKTFNEKVYSYTHLQKSLYWGYEKKDNFLIADPEKALLDQLYLASKGLRGVSIDEYDLSRINKITLKKYLEKYPQTRQFKIIVKKII